MIRALLLASSSPAPAFAAGPPDPDWPCIQRRQPHLSIAQVWAGPLPDEATLALAETPEVQAVAQVIALRRTPMADAEARIAAFAETTTPQALIALFVATFEQINAARDRVMAGITRYAHKQEALDAPDRGAAPRVRGARAPPSRRTSTGSTRSRRTSTGRRASSRTASSR